MRSALLNLSLERPLVAPLVARSVFPGDHPDPTIIRVGQHYWASATSSEWSPQFPLFHSTDLITWTPAGCVFPVQPAWAEGAFWAPELVADRGRFLLYYVARARRKPLPGVLSIAVATAHAPQGPWIDHGPILAEPLGSIDPAFVRDEHGKPFLIWKTDGNSQHQPTPIWAQPLTDDLLRLTGKPTMLITNDQPWEGGLVEGPHIMRHAHRFYFFYAGNDCCGEHCRYAEGVARADRLLGPWTKSPANPLINANDHWRCPGHGTGVHGHRMHGKKGQDYLLYHAYSAEGGVYVGREAVLDEIHWGADGWPTINAGRGPHTEQAASTACHLHDDFRSKTLGPSWQWPVNTLPVIATGNGALQLTVPPARQAAMVALPVPGLPRYMVGVVLRVDAPVETPVDVLADAPPQPDTPTYNPPPPTSWSGLSFVGDPFNTIGLGVRDGRLELWHRRGEWESVTWSQIFAPDVTRIHLRATYHDARAVQFAFSFNQSRVWQNAGPHVDASNLPAWDRGLRIALMLEGPAGSTAVYEDFALKAQ